MPVPTLTAESISGVTGLSARPVYFLKLNGDSQPSVVVKGEAPAGAHTNISVPDALVSIRWGSKLMKNVNNDQVNVKLLTPEEVTAFKRAATVRLQPGSRQSANLFQPYKWVKMPMIRGLSDAEVYGDDNSPDVQLLSTVVPKMYDAAVWRDLGVVVAVDIFNGNSDRFDIETGRWVNKGNVMFLSGGTTAVIGLDTFDPNSGDQGNLASKGGYAALDVLVDARRRDEFALKCTQSVGKELSRIAGRAGLGHVVATIQGGQVQISCAAENLSRLYERFAPDMSTGIAQGSSDLKAYLKKKQQEYAPKPTWQSANPTPANARGIVIGRGRTSQPVKSIPQGIQDRMAHLGW